MLIISVHKGVPRLKRQVQYRDGESWCGCYDQDLDRAEVLPCPGSGEH